MMTTKSEKTKRADMKSQCSGRRRGAGIILAILGVLFLLGTGAARRAQAQTFTVLHSFDYSDGATPFDVLVRDSAGNLYGTTGFGGTSTNCSSVVPSVPSGCGTVFKLDSSGVLTVLHDFTGYPDDGAYPGGLLIDPSSGALYGLTAGGGAHGYGTVFRLETSGALTILHSFNYSDGASPNSLVRDSDGNFYGTTGFGGTSTNCSSGCGTVFQLDTSNTLTVLHDFSGSDGIEPSMSQVRDSDGNFYGATFMGGTSTDCTLTQGCGTVFKVDTSGALTVLHSFTDSEGVFPGPLVTDSEGNLYGTVSGGGIEPNPLGDVFKLDTSGTLTVLHSFAGSPSDGRSPTAGPLRDSDGNLYGTTRNGGSADWGTVYKLDPSGAVTLLHSFSGSDGSKPTDLVRDSNGNLYGTTFGGGTSTKCSGAVPSEPNGCGVVFVISTTPQGAIQVIINQVKGLLAQGLINHGQYNSLVKKLQHAIRMINAGKINGAIGNLEGFIGHVNALENSRRLTGTQGAALTTAATSVIQQLQAM